MLKTRHCLSLKVSSLPGPPYKLRSDGDGTYASADAVVEGDAKEPAVDRAGSETEWGIERCGTHPHTGDRLSNRKWLQQTGGECWNS